MLLVGLTALMVGFYVNELSALTQLIHSYAIPFP